ncbi:MAG TPA: MFS transporter [Stellaceae bacterium]|nr:MFS transporter [Stellaceae bacterium]
MDNKSIDVTRLIDEQQIGSFTIFLVMISFIIMLADGYDLLAASYGAPTLIASWHVKPAMLGPVFSASPVGMIVGSPLLGWLGDRYGRRITVMLGLVIFGVASIFCAMATSIPELMVLRFLTGIGLGGMLPNITALNAEFAPKRLRATLTVLMFLGVPAGSAMPAVVVAAVHGSSWQTLYWVGGIVPLVLAAVVYFWLPESLKFLTLRQTPKSRAILQRTVRRVRPDLVVDATTTFFTSEVKRPGVPVAELFQDGLQFITPLLWLLFVTNLSANYFLYSWMPVLFHASGFTASQAALTTACYYVGAVTGGLLVSRFIDKKGFLPVAIFYSVGVPAVACIGLPGLPHWAAISLVFLGGFCVLGAQLGINAGSSLIYPTRIRATGTGWAFGLGRLGGIAGPMLGAWLISMHLSTSQLFIAPAVPLAVGAIACLFLVRLCRRRFGGDQLSDNAAGSVVSPGMASPAGLSIQK